jgi:hypothetical protein
MMMLIVLLAATSVPAPSFVMTPVAGENFSAEVFEQTESVTSEALIDRSSVNREMAPRRRFREEGWILRPRSSSWH